MLEVVCFEEVRGTMERTWGKDLVGAVAERERRHVARPRQTPILVRLAQAFGSAISAARSSGEDVRRTRRGRPMRSAS
jgi:hypothetical protein